MEHFVQSHGVFFNQANIKYAGNYISLYTNFYYYLSILVHVKLFWLLWNIKYIYVFEFEYTIIKWFPKIIHLEVLVYVHKFVCSLQISVSAVLASPILIRRK